MMSYYRNISGICPSKIEMKGSVSALKHAISIRFFSFDLIWSIENRESKINLSRRKFLKRLLFYHELNILDGLASMTKQFSAYLMQIFKFKDEAVHKNFING